MIRENIPQEGITYVWTYDNAGNILARSEYEYTTNANLEEFDLYDSASYTYGNENWGDLLTGYGTKTVTYDQIGNPETFGDRTFAWEHGRQLKSLEEGNTTWNYTYDADGMRTGRTDGTTANTYTYIYTGSQLTQMKKGTETLTFTYDASGIPLTVTYGSTKYYYAVNVQGDVVAILNSSGTAVAYYGYDAWGNALSSYTSGIGFLNPLRYRGYVYDTETGLYYVSSRYYDPEVSRWINADDAEILLEDYEAMLQYNLFAYCWNNPVNMYDPDGYWTLALAGGGYLATAGTLGASNIWNPVGWIILGAVVVTTVVVVATNVYNSEKTSSSNEADPYARPGQKKQGQGDGSLVTFPVDSANVGTRGRFCCPLPNPLSRGTRGRFCCPLPTPLVPHTLLCHCEPQFVRQGTGDKGTVLLSPPYPPCPAHPSLSLRAPICKTGDSRTVPLSQILLKKHQALSLTKITTNIV